MLTSAVVMIISWWVWLLDSYKHPVSSVMRPNVHFSAQPEATTVSCQGPLEQVCTHMWTARTWKRGCDVRQSPIFYFFFQPSVCPSITPADTHSNSHTDSPLHHCSGPRTKPLSGQTNILLLSVQPFLGRWWTVNRARLNSLIKAGHKRPSQWRQLVLCSAFSSYQPREVRSKKMKPSRRDRVTVEWKAESEKHKGAGAKL